MDLIKFKLTSSAEVQWKRQYHLVIASLLIIVILMVDLSDGAYGEPWDRLYKPHPRTSFSTHEIPISSTRKPSWLYNSKTGVYHKRKFRTTPTPIPTPVVNTDDPSRPMTRDDIFAPKTSDPTSNLSLVKPLDPIEIPPPANVPLPTTDLPRLPDKQVIVPNRVDVPQQVPQIKNNNQPSPNPQLIGDLDEVPISPSPNDRDSERRLDLLTPDNPDSIEPNQPLNPVLNKPKVPKARNDASIKEIIGSFDETAQTMSENQKKVFLNYHRYLLNQLHQELTFDNDDNVDLD